MDLLTIRRYLSYLALSFFLIEYPFILFDQSLTVIIGTILLIAAVCVMFGPPWSLIPLFLCHLILVDSWWSRPEFLRGIVIEVTALLLTTLATKNSLIRILPRANPKASAEAAKKEISHLDQIAAL
jgi:hypothetical protein